MKARRERCGRMWRNHTRGGEKDRGRRWSSWSLNLLNLNYSRRNKRMCTHSLWGDGGPLPQRWSCGDRGAENRPSQSHCRSGSKGEFAPGVKVKCYIKFFFLLGKWTKTALCLLSVCCCRCCRCWTHRFVLDGGAGDTQVELPILLHAGFNQSLHRALLLEQQERVS